MRIKKKKLWDKLKFRYKITVTNDTTLEETFSAKLSMLHGIITMSVVAVIGTALIIILLAFTNLKVFIPGFPSGQLRAQIISNMVRADSLEQEIYKRDQYFQGLREVFGQNVTPLPDSPTLTEVQENVSPLDTMTFAISETESAFRAEIEQKERFNLSVGMKNQENEYYHFFPPVEGIVSRAYNEKNKHFGTDIVAKQDAKVTSVLDGMVVFADWTIKTGYVIHVQHKNNLLSIYKHNSVLLKQQGDYVRAGEVLAVVGNTGEESSGAHLHFELWRGGNPLDPENFIKFK
ncbi:MAG: murein hydrolase activator EnvC family protein [Marinifilaceae bacterium]